MKQHLSFLAAFLCLSLIGVAQETHVISVAINQEDGCSDVLKLSQELQFKLYPNPAAQYVNISFSEEITEVLIYNLSGQLSGSYLPMSNEATIDLISFNSGIHLVKVITRSQVFQRKLSIEQ